MKTNRIQGTSVRSETTNTWQSNPRILSPPQSQSSSKLEHSSQLRRSYHAPRQYLHPSHCNNPHQKPDDAMRGKRPLQSPLKPSVSQSLHSRTRSRRLSKRSSLSQCFRATWKGGESADIMGWRNWGVQKIIKKAFHIFNLPVFLFIWPHVVENCIAISWYAHCFQKQTWLHIGISSQCSPQHTTTVDPPTNQARLCRDYTASAFLRPRDWLQLSNQD